MFSLQSLLNEIYDVFKQRQTLFEIILNISFIIILLAFAAIFYWDSINRSVINSSRCKVIINNEDVNYKIDVVKKDDNSKKLLTVSYDNTKQHNIRVDCACPTGSTTNLIPFQYYDYKTQQLETIQRNCKCDNDYQVSSANNDSYSYIGDAFLVDFYKNTNTSGKLYFPE